MHNLKIVMLLNRYLPVIGGAEIQAAQLCDELRQRGHEIHVVTRRLTRELPPREIIRGIPVRRLSPVGLGHLANALIVGRMIEHLVTHRREYDVIHVHTIGPLGLAAVMAGQIVRKPVVLKVPGYGGLRRRDSSGVLPSRYSRIVRRYLLPPVVWKAILRRASAIVGLSDEILEEGRSIGLENLVHIPNGVDTGRFCPISQEQRGVLRERLGLPTGSKLVLFSGRLVAGKRVDVLLTALPSVLDKHRDCCVLIAGSGHFQQGDVEARLHEIVRKLDINDYVRFLGQVNAIEDYLQAVDVFVFPSEHEGMPNAILEAMATGLPIVASRIGGVTDLLSDEIAWLVSPGDSDALAEALCAVLDDPDEAVRRGRLVRERAERDFSLSVVASRYEQLYLRLIT